MKLLATLMVTKLFLAQAPVAVAPPPDSAAETRLAATVESCKPLLTKRHVFRVKGKGAPGATWSAGYTVTGGVITISLQGNGAGAGAATQPFELDVDIPQLQGKKDKFEIVVVDSAGAELLRSKN